MGLQPFFAPCKECSAEGYTENQLIVNKRHMLCVRHNRIRLDLQGVGSEKKPSRLKRNRFSQTFEYCTDWGFSKEMDMYLWIWDNRPHVSFFTGRPISSFRPHCFVHVLAKGLNKFPHFRFNPENVVLGLLEEHNLIDAGTQEQREAYKKEFPQYNLDEFYLLESHLREEYRKRFG